MIGLTFLIILQLTLTHVTESGQISALRSLASSRAESNVKHSKCSAETDACASSRLHQQAAAHRLAGWASFCFLLTIKFF